MKLSRNENRGKRGDQQVPRRVIRHANRSRSQDQVTEMLKLCLQKICELQAEMALDEESEQAHSDRAQTTEHDPQAAGYAACAIEALRFLSAQGLTNDHPMVKALREKLLNGMEL